MQLTNQQNLPVSQQIAWDALNDTELLQQCIPGCESMQSIGDNQYEVLILAAIGPVKAKFKGKLQLGELDPPNAYTMQFDGQGGAAGHGKGKAHVRLESVGANETVLHYEVQASVGGKIAQIGSRLVDMAAAKMAADFFERFDARLRERFPPAAEAPVAAPPPPPQGVLARFFAWLKRLFGG